MVKKGVEKPRRRAGNETEPGIERHDVAAECSEISGEMGELSGSCLTSSMIHLYICKTTQSGYGIGYLDRRHRMCLPNVADQPMCGCADRYTQTRLMGLPLYTYTLGFKQPLF